MMLSVPLVDSDIIMSSNKVTLNTQDTTKCVSMIFNGTRECIESEKNYTIRAEQRESKDSENSVIFSRQEATIVISTMSKFIIMLSMFTM